MIDICRNDRPTARHLFSNKLCRDRCRNSVPRMSVNPGSLFLVPQVFPDRDIFHFRGDDPLPRVPELRDRMTAGSADRFPLQTGKKFQLSAPPIPHGALHMHLAQVPVIDRKRRATFILFHIRTAEDPVPPQRWQSFSDIPLERRVTPRSAGVVNCDTGIFFGPAVRQSGGGLRYFPQTHLQVGVDLTWNVNSTAVWVIFGGGHGNRSAGPLWRLLPSTVLSVSGSKGPPN